MQRGDRIGNYELESELGATATCTIYRASHQLLPRRAVVKLARAVGDWTRQRSIEVLREACLLEALHHPGVVRIHEAGRLADGRGWFAAELVEGLTIADALLQGPIEPAVAVGMLRDTADVLAHAHRRGVIHGGLAPEGVVVTGKSRGFPLCLTDWAQARTYDAPRAPQPPTPYAAPELARDDRIDDRIDVYALGALAYHVLTGVAPVPHGPPLVGIAPADAPRELVGLVEQMLADPWDRPSASEALADHGWIAEQLTPPPKPTPRFGRIRRPRWTPPLVYEHREDAAPHEIDERDEPTGKLRRPT